MARMAGAGDVGLTGFWQLRQCHSRPDLPISENISLDSLEIFGNLFSSTPSIHVKELHTVKETLKEGGKKAIRGLRV